MRQILSRLLYASFSSERAAPLAAFMRFSAIEPATTHTDGERL